MIADSISQVIQSVLAHILPPKIDYGIAFVGCSGIVNDGHFPASKQHSFNRIGGYDQKREAGEKTVWEHKLEKASETLDDVLSEEITSCL